MLGDQHGLQLCRPKENEATSNLVQNLNVISLLWLKFFVKKFGWKKLNSIIVRCVCCGGWGACPLLKDTYETHTNLFYTDYRLDYTCLKCAFFFFH